MQFRSKFPFVSIHLIMVNMAMTVNQLILRDTRFHKSLIRRRLRSRINSSVPTLDFPRLLVLLVLRPGRDLSLIAIHTVHIPITTTTTTTANSDRLIHGPRKRTSHWIPLDISLSTALRMRLVLPFGMFQDDIPCVYNAR